MAAGLTTVTTTINGVEKQIIVGSDAGGDLAPGHVAVDQDGAPFMTPTNPASVAVVANKTLTPAACTGSLTLAVANVAQNAQLAGSGNGAVVVLYNPDNAADQGIGAAEAIWVNAVTTAAPASGGTSLKLNPGASISIGPTIGAVSWIAATVGHKIEGYTLT